MTQGHRILSVIVDDNHQGIQECSDYRIHTVHIKLRRKPAVEDAEVVKSFLILETAEPLFARFKMGRSVITGLLPVIPVITNLIQFYQLQKTVLKYYQEFRYQFCNWLRAGM